MTTRCDAILISLLSVAKAHQKKYCWISQRRLQDLLIKYHKIGLSNRTLNRDLRWLEQNGYIARLRRIRIGQDGKLVFNSTLYKFTGKLFNYLYSIANRVKRLFGFFRLPKWADHKHNQQQGSITSLPGNVEKVLIKERDGSLHEYYPSTGVYQRLPEVLN